MTGAYSSSALLAAVAVLLAATTWLVQTLRIAYFSPLSKIPGPWYANLTNLRLKAAVLSGQRLHYIHALHQRYGPIVRISPTEIAIADVESFKEIHRAGSGFNKSIWYEKLNNNPNLGVFSMRDPKEHAARRKMFARAFSKTYLRQNWEPIVLEKARMAVAKIKRDAENGTADVLKWWMFLATDVSGHLMFGESFRMLEQEESEDNLYPSARVGVDGVWHRRRASLLRAILQFMPVPSMRKMFRANDYLLEYGTSAIDNARAQGGKANIFATILSEAEKGEGSLTDLDVRIEAGNLIVAGSDTTGNTMTYLTWAVLQRVGLRIALEEEVQRLNADITDTAVEALPLLNAVIEETLRLYGAAPGSLLRVVPRGGATLGGYFIPEGVTVSTQSYTLHRDPNLFHNPDNFDPSRWLPGQTIPDTTKAAYSPFGTGPRICLGIHLARMELRLAAALFFRECKGAELAPSTTPESMALENYFLIAPVSHRCEITMKG